jgi:flagellar motility protein MotE (MotC chaperone)
MLSYSTNERGFDMKNITKYGFEQVCMRIEEIIYTYFDQEIGNYNYSKDFENITTYDLENRKMTFFLSNGETLNYSINRNNLSHLLGIDTSYLIACGLYDKNLSSFEILERIVTSPGNLYRKHEQGIIDINKLVSPYVERKLEAFKQNAFIDFNNIYLICKYDENRAYGLNNDLHASYIMVQEIDNKYYLYILSKNDNGKYIPVSSQLYESYDELYDNLSDKIINQELVIATSLNIRHGYSDPKKLWLNKVALASKLKNLNEQSKVFQCIPNVLASYSYSQKVIDRKDAKQIIDSDYLSIIASIMKQKRVIDIEELGTPADIDSKIFDIINAYNDSLFNKPGVDGEATFSELKTVNVNLNSKLEETLRQYEELKEKHDELEKKYSDQEKNLEELEHKIQEVRKVLG